MRALVILALICLPTLAPPPAFAETGLPDDGGGTMPAFGEILGQKAAWAIRTHIETRPEDGALDAHKDRLIAIRDELASGGGDEAALKAELTGIAAVVV